MFFRNKIIFITLTILLIAGVGVTYFSHKANVTKVESGVTPDQVVHPSATQQPTATPAPTPKPEPEIPTEKVDVVLIGSELEGLYLARAAADEGLKVKVLDPSTDFGGQVLQAEMLFLDEAKDKDGRTLLQGRVKELFDGFKAAKIRKLPEFKEYFDKKLVKDLPVESGIKISEVKTVPGSGADESVQALTYETNAGVKKKITASYWVDNTDDASLMRHLKVTRTPGLEAFYGQSHIEYMSTGFMMKFKNVDWNKFKTQFNALSVEDRNKKYGYGLVNDSFAISLAGMTSRYKPTNDRIFLRGWNALNQRDGEVLINALLVYTIDPTDPKSVAEGLEIGKIEMPLVLDHFRKNVVGWENAELNGFPKHLYIREYNHYEMEYMLKPSDMLGGKMFWDNMSIAGYPLDLQGTSANKWGIEMGVPDKYGMPLRSFLLKKYDNVIAAGKNVGATAIAYGSARIQPNTSLAAESIGIIIAQTHGKKKLKELNETDMATLHHYLQTKYAIKLTGVTGLNKLAGWTPDEITKLDKGEIVYSQHKKK